MLTCGASKRCGATPLEPKDLLGLVRNPDRFAEAIQGRPGRQPCSPSFLKEISSSAPRDDHTLRTTHTCTPLHGALAKAGHRRARSCGQASGTATGRVEAAFPPVEGLTSMTAGPRRRRRAPWCAGRGRTAGTGTTPAAATPLPPGPHPGPVTDRARPATGTGRSVEPTGTIQRQVLRAGRRAVSTTAHPPGRPPARPPRRPARPSAVDGGSVGGAPSVPWAACARVPR